MPDEALRRTKERLRRTPGWEAPRLWAAFVLVGDPPPVVAGSRSWLLAAAAAVLLAAASVWLRRRAHR